MITFPISGVETHWWLPALVAFGISAVASLGGLSGAFLLLPFQISVLGYVGPSVSATNLLFNVIATPAGVIGQMREKRMVWPLALVLSLGALPGVFLGAWARVALLPDPRAFKIFVALVLTYIAGRLLWSALHAAPKARAGKGDFITRDSQFSWRRCTFSFQGEAHSVSTPVLLVLSMTMGVISAAYGIGGGAFLAPILVTMMGVPVYVVAGPAMLNTFVSSLGGIAAYALLGAIGVAGGDPLQPDWALGALLGVGGVLGISLGTRLQRFVSPRAIKLVLAGSIAIVIVRYTIELLAG